MNISICCFLLSSHKKLITALIIVAVKMSEPILYRICWSEPNGNSGYGEKILTWESAQSWLDYLHKKHPDMKHWLGVE